LPVRIVDYRLKSSTPALKSALQIFVYSLVSGNSFNFESII